VTFFFTLKTAYFFDILSNCETRKLGHKMSEDVSTTQPDAAILQNARIKKAGKTKGVSKARKARPLKNLEQAVLLSRLVELQKRVRTAECKMTLLKEKLVVHEDEAATRANVPTDETTA
jgi:hypothetical protein